ncbi:hypothetical protein [Butyrivibrio sp. AE3006]|uniref:hypothetical protein n=1 Tax=Butyrivibrio sp. AE3006 TaxID=1280673 RepID=UPI000414167A|nr:hypothetical protein [Butyrivibrio sp. AE3006]
MERVRNYLMNEKEKELFDFLDEKKALVLAEVKDLASQDRMDESNILKAKSNIYDICKAVFGAATKKASDGNVKDTFLSTFGNITGQWQKSLEQAKAHDDSYKILIEEAKLSAVSEILEKIDELF